MNWARTESFGHQLNLDDVIFHVSLIIDGVTLFFQLMDVQNVCKSAYFSPSKSYVKF